MAKIPAMTDEGRAKVSAAVSAVERRTAGEVVTIVTQQSDDYAEVALLWSIFVAFLALAALALFPDFYLGIYDRLTGSWVQEIRWYVAVAALAALAAFPRTRPDKTRARARARNHVLQGGG